MSAAGKTELPWDGDLSALCWRWRGGRERGLVSLLFFPPHVTTQRSLSVALRQRAQRCAKAPSVTDLASSLRRSEAQHRRAFHSGPNKELSICLTAKYGRSRFLTPPARAEKFRLLDVLVSLILMRSHKSTRNSWHTSEISGGGRIPTRTEVLSFLNLSLGGLQGIVKS